MRLGITLFDPYVAILDRKRFELASSDDAALSGRTAFASIVAPADGTYIVQVRESAYAGNGGVPLPPARRQLPPADGRRPGRRQGRRGARRQLARRRRRARSRPKVKLPGRSPAGDFGLFAQDDEGIAPSPNLFRLTPLGNVIEAEPNDDHAARPRRSQPPLALNGVIEQAGRRRSLPLHGQEGPDLRHPLSTPAGSARRSTRCMYLGKKGGGASPATTTPAGPTATSASPCPRTASTSSGVTDHLGKGGPDYAYRVEVTPGRADADV